MRSEKFRAAFKAIAAVAAGALGIGMIAAPSASAATYTDNDQFIAGELQSNHAVNLTVTKYWSNVEGGSDYTGSEQDASKVASDSRPAQGVVFSLTKINPTANHTASDFTNTNGDLNADGTTKPVDANTAWTRDTSVVYYGVTNASGVINQWGTTYTEATHSVSDTTALPTGHSYYVLHEVYSPDSSYSRAEDSVFDLAYRATQTDGNTKTDGYVYNLHVYPKNVNTNPLSKTVTNVNGDTKSLAAKAGDTIEYNLAYRFDGLTRPANETDTTVPANQQKLYFNDVQGSYTDVRIADRMSSAFANERVNSVKLMYDSISNPNTNGIDLVQGTDYRQSTTAPTRLNSTDPLFTSDSTTHGDKHYLVFDFFGKAANTYSIPADATNIRILIDLTATATSNGDSLGHSAGSLVNDAAVDTHFNWHNETHANTASAGFQFAKVKTDNTALAGAVFRLTDPSVAANDHFLASDGNFYADGSLPNNVTFIQATSNADGVVTFVNLPVFNRDENNNYTFRNDNLTFNVVEYQAPEGYKRSTVAFERVSWQSHAGQAITDAQNGTFFASDTQLDFGEWKADAASLNITGINGQQITNGLKNWRNNEPGQPIHLPLTGGQGILLLVAAGMVIMGIVLIERKRRASRN